ncbi:MAG: cell division protein FtsA [Saprospiraceae bacterium]|nr:cell division protein FtsA [Saprospiraceae bacterium]
MEKQIIVALDIGTTKICAMVGRMDMHGKLEILGTGKVESVGVLRGVVSNIEKTIKAISEAIAEAERRSGVEIGVVNVGIAGQHIKSLQHRGILTRNSLHDEISQEDIDDLISDMYKLVLPPGDKIIHVIPQEYIVDNEQGIVDPIGMSGIRLEANFHIITAQTTATKNIAKCVQKSGLKMTSLALEPIASSSSVLSEAEMEAGVALVDIGGGTTDIAIFHEGIIRHTAVVPLGGNIITKDIKDGCNVMGNQAEKLKVKFGSAIASALNDNRVITIPGLRGQSHKEISEKNLSRIIQARMEEIMDLIYWEIRRSGYERKLIGGIVLTGGGALLKNVVDLVELQTGLSARLGIPTEHLAHGYDKEITSPIYSTSVGLILNGFKELERGYVYESSSSYASNAVPVLLGQKITEGDEKSNKWYEKVFKRTKEWFEAEPDGDL